MRRFGLALLIMSIACLAAPAFADEGVTDCSVCSRTTSDNWGVKTGSQLGRGVANAGSQIAHDCPMCMWRSS